jgi:Protein of unknown function (DUF4038)/Putative collagen-binding domain of a collagenase
MTPKVDIHQPMHTESPAPASYRSARRRLLQAGAATALSALLPAWRHGPLVPGALLYGGLATMPRVGPSVDFGHGALQVHANGRFIQHADGTPFFWLADTWWIVPHESTIEEVEIGMDDRRAKGFTVLQMCCTSFDVETDAATTNRFGDRPFDGPGVTNPNADYFRYIEDMIDLAATKGIYVALLPFWGGWQFWTGNTKYIETFTTTTAASFGTYLGQRFASKQNIIWMLGGDSDVGGIGETSGVSGRIAKWQALADAILAKDINHLMTFHPAISFGFHNGNYPTPDNPQGWPLQSESWLDFGGCQTGSHQINIPTYDFVADCFARTPIKPCANLEPSYENQTVDGMTSIDIDIRQAAYWSVFAGGCGHTYGQHALWSWGRDGSGLGGSSSGTVPFWYDGINALGSRQMGYLRNLMEARPFFDRMPDQKLVVDTLSGADKVVCCRSASNAMIYTAGGQSITAVLGKISGSQVKVYGFDPRTGAVTYADTYPNTGTQVLNSPGSPARGNDYVFLLDDAAQSFPVPGLATYQ